MIDIIVYIECGLLLTLIWVGFSGIRFEVGWEESPPPYTNICSFRKYTFQYQGPLNFVDVRIFWQKISIFGNNSTFTQSNIVRALL